MIAFKTFSQAPVEEKPAGIPDGWPWIETAIQPSEQVSYTLLGFTVMQDAEYRDYKEHLYPAYLLWAVANNFGSDPLKELTDFKAAQGFEVYKTLVSMLDQGGGISSVDTGLQAYALITPIRNMLKDGFFTYALRHYCREVRTLSLFPTELDTFFVATLSQICIDWGSTSAEVENIISGETA